MIMHRRIKLTRGEYKLQIDKVGNFMKNGNWFSVLTHTLSHIYRQICIRHNRFDQAEIPYCSHSL